MACHAKSGPGPGPILVGKNGPGGPLFSAKSGPSLPKVDLVQFCQEKSGLVQFHCHELDRSIFGKGKKWTRSSFTTKIQAGPILAREKSGPSPVSLPKSRQVKFWQGKKVDPVQFHCRNPGRSNFGKGKKWTLSSFAAEIQAGPFWQGIKVDPVQFRCRK